MRFFVILFVLCATGFTQEFSDWSEQAQKSEFTLGSVEQAGVAGSKMASRGREKIQAEAPAMFDAVDEKTYLVGPGDIFYIALGTDDFDTPVGPDGNVIIQNFPPIPVGGKTLAEAKTVLAEKMKRYFKAGGIYIALSAAKKFQVSITGAVNVPGMYIAAPGYRLSNAIQSAGGVARHASHQVILKHASGKTETFNLGGYYRNGDMEQNPTVSQGDQIFLPGIDYSAPYVYVQSEKGLRLLQLSAEDDLESLVARASDYQRANDWDHVNVYREGKFVEKVLRSNGRGYTPQNGTTLEVRSTQLYVFIAGTVIAPGAVPYNPTFSMLDYVARTGITVNTGDVDKIVVLDAAGKVRKVNAKTEAPQPGDHIYVPRSGEAKTRDYIGLTAAISGLAITIATFLLLLNQ
jgi:protein involved in polysaccharide export with SLBB domain